MSRICSACGKGGMVIKRRSHSNVATKRVQKVNLQTRRINGQKQRLCSGCLKKIKLSA